jgi:hypothetical protein
MIMSPPFPRGPVVARQAVDRRHLGAQGPDSVRRHGGTLPARAPRCGKMARPRSARHARRQAPGRARRGRRRPPLDAPSPSTDPSVAILATSRPTRIGCHPRAAAARATRPPE